LILPKCPRPSLGRPNIELWELAPKTVHTKSEAQWKLKL